MKKGCNKRQTIKAPYEIQMHEWTRLIYAKMEASARILTGNLGYLWVKSIFQASKFQILRLWLYKSNQVIFRRTI